MVSRVATVLAGLILASSSRAGDAGQDNQVVGRELGSMLAWRLGPEAIVEACRPIDPAGADGRETGLKSWREKNAALIQEVDASVAELVPLAYPSRANVDTVQAVRGQVRKIVLEPMFSGRTPEETAAICKAEADPANPRWKSNGMPHVRAALAALYDWKIQRTAK